MRAGVAGRETKVTSRVTPHRGPTCSRASELQVKLQAMCRSILKHHCRSPLVMLLSRLVDTDLWRMRYVSVSDAMRQAFHSCAAKVDRAGEMEMLCK